jgi:hypothetical protein
MPRVAAGVWATCALLLMTGIGRSVAHAAQTLPGDPGPVGCGLAHRQQSPCPPAPTEGLPPAEARLENAD